MSPFMKTVRYPAYFLLLLLTVGLGVGAALRAGDQAPAAPAPEAAPTAAAEPEKSAPANTDAAAETPAEKDNDAVVSVLGSSRVTGGTVGDVVVSVLGDTYINGHVKGGVVTVFGDVEFGPNAVVDDQVVCVGGDIKRDPAAVLKGDVQVVGIRGVTIWFKQCVLKARLLAFDFRVWWAWCIALAFLTFYFLLALVL